MAGEWPAPTGCGRIRDQRWDGVPTFSSPAIHSPLVARDRLRYTPEHRYVITLDDAEDDPGTMNRLFVALFDNPPDRGRFVTRYFDKGEFERMPPSVARGKYRLPDGDSADVGVAIIRTTMERFGIRGSVDWIST